MAEPETPYEHTPAFSTVERKLREELKEWLRERLVDLEQIPKESYLRKTAIESAGCGYLYHTMKRFWTKLLVPAPLSPERRLQFLRSAVDDAYREVLECGYYGYQGIEEYREFLMQQDPARFCSTPNGRRACAAEGGPPNADKTGESEPSGDESTRTESGPAEPEPTTTGRKRGRPQTIPDERKVKAVALKASGGTNSAVAAVLYDKRFPTPQEVKNVPSHLRAFSKKLKRPGSSPQTSPRSPEIKG